MSTARTCLLALVVCAVGTAAIPYLSCYVYHHDRKISFAEYCDYSESNACITVSARMANDHKFFNASCTRQTCAEFERDLKAKIVNRQMWLVNYTCCTDSVCNGHADGYQLSNATLNPVELPKAKMADDPEGSGEGAMIEGSGEDENGSGEDDREFGCFVYSSNLGKAREQLCSQGRSRSCVSYNAKLHHDKEQANAYCTDLPCGDIDANFEKQAAQRTVKSIEYTCCSEKYCNAKADSKRVDAPPKNAKAERRQQKLIRTLCSKEERPRWCEDRFPTEPPAPLPVQVAVPFEDQLLSAPQLSLPRPQFAANGVQQQNDFAPWKVLSRHLGDERAPVFFF